MTSDAILITAAAGQTGGHAARQLLKAGHPVRAMVRQQDTRSEALAAAGAEVVVGDMNDAASVRRALDGVKRAYFCAPWQPRVLESTTRFALIGRELGLEVTVNMSQMIVREGHPSPATREHWLAEHVLDWAGVGACHLRAGLFADNMLGLAGPTVASERRIYLPFGKGLHAPVTTEDVGAVVAGLLSAPADAHTGERLVVTGPEDLTIDQVADAIGEVVSDEVQYVQIPVSAWLENLKQLPQMNAHFLAHLEQLAPEVARGAFAGPSDVVARVGGRPPKSFSTFAADHIAVFGGER